MDKDLRLKLLEKDRAYTIAQTSKKDTDWAHFLDLKPTTRKSFITNKRIYILAKLDENRENPKNFWREMDVNLSVGKNKSQTGICDRIRDTTGCIVTGLEATKAFNNF